MTPAHGHSAPSQVGCPRGVRVAVPPWHPARLADAVAAGDVPRVRAREGVAAVVVACPPFRQPLRPLSAYREVEAAPDDSAGLARQLTISDPSLDATRRVAQQAPDQTMVLGG